MNEPVRLTRRQREVVDLVVRGLTNREIARQLFISERTADSHLEQIRNKLGVSSRAQISAWAVEQKSRSAGGGLATQKLNAHQGRAEPASSRLPMQLTTFIGRRRELFAVSSLLGQTRLVTITGAAGTGKTRLAVEVASRFASDKDDGAWFVGLESLEDGVLLAPEVAAALEVADLDHDLAASRRLVVLDNCEQIAAGCRDLIHRLLAASPGLKVLATSREPLHVPGEGVWGLEPLSSAESVDLFLDRIRLAAPDISVGSADAGLVQSICADLDGLPLAIELAASRARLMSLEDIRKRLHSRFRLLVGHESTIARQQTLEAAVAWSYDLLTADQQMLFRHLGAFAGGFFLDSAQALLASPTIPAERVPELVDRLVDRSLVVAERTPGRPTRYRLLVTMREYARERLAESGALASLRTVHARHYRALAERAGAEMQGPKQAEWLNRIEDELDEFRAALEWSLEADPESALVIAGELTWFWGMRGRVAEGRRALAAALPMVPARTLMRGRALIGAGWLARLQNDLEVGAAFHAESVDILREFDDPVQLGLALVWSAEAASTLNDWQTARAGWVESIDLLEPLGPNEPLAYAMLELAVADLVDRRPDSARDYAHKGMAMMAELGNVRAYALGRMAIGYAAYLDANFGEAWAEVTECLASLRRTGALGDLTQPLNAAAIVAVAMGQPEVGVRLGAAVERLRSTTGSMLSVWQGDLQRALDQARARLGDAAYADAWERGRAMDVDGAMNLVQDTSYKPLGFSENR